MFVWPSQKLECANILVNLAHRNPPTHPPPPLALAHVSACITVVVWLVHSTDLMRYAKSSVATGRVSQARQIKSEGPDKDRCPYHPGWRFGIGLTSQSHKRIFVQREQYNLNPNWMDVLALRHGQWSRKKNQTHKLNIESARLWSWTHSRGVGAGVGVGRNLGCSWSR
jgi:hypothetical protein